VRISISIIRIRFFPDNLREFDLVYLIAKERSVILVNYYRVMQSYLDAAIIQRPRIQMRCFKECILTCQLSIGAFRSIYALCMYDACIRYTVYMICRFKSILYNHAKCDVKYSASNK